MYGVSKDKFTKDGRPKRAGNFSKVRMHYVTKSYPCVINPDGTVTIGDHTPGETLLRPELIEMMKKDKFFKHYEQEGVYPYMGRDYKCWRHITINPLRIYDAPTFIFTMSIDTEGDFVFEFPEF